MKKILIVLLLISGSAFAQKIPDYGFNKVRIVLDDKIIQAELKPVISDPEVNVSRLYYWYSSNVIHVTQGGFSGKLVNGEYAEYYLSKNLKEEGEFKKGLKDGIWKSWNENGTMTQLYTWKNGVKSGKYMLFDDHGNLKQSGNYDDNLLDGPIKTYEGPENKATIITYHNGTVVTKKPSAFWHKIRPFKKKDSKVNRATEQQAVKPTP